MISKNSGFVLSLVAVIMKSITKRDIVIHLSSLPEKVFPTHKKFKEECIKFVCENLSIKPAHLNSNMKAMISRVQDLYRKSGLYLSF